MIERQVIVTWHKPEEKLPLTDELVIVTVSGKIANIAFDHCFAIASYCEGEGWWIDCAQNKNDMGDLTVHAWCDLEPYGGKWMSDLISRESVRAGRIPYDEDLTEYQRGWNDACDAIADNAPEAQRDHNASYSRSRENDPISRQTAMDFVGSMEMCDEISVEAYQKLMNYLEELPSAQPERPEQDILAWLLAYHMKSFDLKGRYMAHEVIGWLVHDFATAYMAER